MSESFEKVYDRLYPQLHNPCSLWKAATIREWLDDLMTAHDHEIEQLRRSRFHEGYVAGQRSMDAEHRAVAMRLRGLRFDGGSHENLSKIAYAIYPCATGWTVESCEGLRDRIIDLLGGVYDGISDCVCGGACADGCRDSHGEQEAVDADDSVSDVRADVPASDGVANSPFTQVTYDVLGNERYKAVCKLRYIRDCLEDNSISNSLTIADAIGARLSVGERVHESICDRLIHLLGGDEPTLREIATELSKASVDAMSRRAESYKIGENCETDASDTGESSKCRESCESGHITDELREWASIEVPYKYGRQLHAIADRIDERARLGAIKADIWQDHANQMRAECNELQAKLDEADAAIANWREREKSFAESERLRDELQAKLDAIREAIDE